MKPAAVMAQRPYPPVFQATMQPLSAGPVFQAKMAGSLAPPPMVRQPAIQRYCGWCTDPTCNHGSRCGNGANAGTYGSRKADQQQLGKEFGSTVSGKTHQMEHPFGYAVLAGPLHKPGQRGKTPQTHEIERDAPAYHEEYAQHRRHEGTGNVGDARESGLNSADYRSWQRTALEQGDLDVALAINQMSYAHQTLAHNPVPQQQAESSYHRMVMSMGSVPLGTPGGIVQLPGPTDDQRFDMLVMRFQTQNQRDPSPAEQTQIIVSNGLRVSWLPYPTML